jgi:hypothetical protein
VKAGDLVKMKFTMWWMLQDRKDFTEEVRIVLEKDYNAVKLLCSDGMVRSSLSDHWEVISESL